VKLARKRIPGNQKTPMRKQLTLPTSLPSQIIKETSALYEELSVSQISSDKDFSQAEA
jgi:hypothetical protein